MSGSLVAEILNFGKVGNMSMFVNYHVSEYDQLWSQAIACMKQSETSEVEEEAIDAEQYPGVLKGVVEVLHHDGGAEEGVDDDVQLVVNA